MFRTMEDIISSLQYIYTPSTRVSYIFLASLTKPFSTSLLLFSFKTAFFRICTHDFVRNSIFSHLCFCFRSKQLFSVSDHMISLKTVFFRICTHDFVRKSLFQHLCFCFRSKLFFFVSEHMISLETAFFRICTHDFVRNSIFSYLYT